MMTEADTSAELTESLARLREQLRQEVALALAPWAWELNSLGESHRILVETDTSDVAGVIAALAPLCGHVNDREYLGAATGTLFASGLGYNERLSSKVVMAFWLRRHPFNHLRFPDGEYRPVFDRDGKPPYPSADFGAVMGEDALHGPNYAPM